MIARIDRYLRKSGVPPTRFSREVARDPRLYHDMVRCGRQPGPAMQARIAAYLEERGA